MSVDPAVSNGNVTPKTAAGPKTGTPYRWNLIPWYVEAFSGSGIPGTIKK